MTLTFLTFELIVVYWCFFYSFFGVKMFEFMRIDDKLLWFLLTLSYQRNSLNLDRISNGIRM